MQPKSALA
jgi:hypothetical protein